MKRTALALTIILALIILIVAGTKLVNVASANFFPEPTPQGIRIESAGSVNGTDKIQRNGNVYILTGNIYETIVILRDNIIIDGAGFTLQGQGNFTGIFLQDRINVTIKNMEIRNFHYGIKLTWKNLETGSRDNTIIGNKITGNTVGILLNLFTKNNFVYENSVTNNTYGIQIVHSPNSVLKNNGLANNQYNLWIDIQTAVPASEYVNDIDNSNTVDDKPIYYWVDQHNKIVPSDAGYVALVDCTGITVENLNLKNNGQGVLLVSTNNSLITKNYITNTGHGIALYGPYVSCAYNTVTKNVIVGSIEEGIYEWDGFSNNIYDNTITASPEVPSPSPSLSPTPSQEPTPSPEPQPEELFPTTIAVASIAILSVIGFGILVYFKKRRP